MYRNKKNGIIGIIITIIILILVVIFSNGETNSNFIENAATNLIMPIQNGLTYLKNKLGGNNTFFTDINNLKDENKELKQKNSELEQSLRELENIKTQNGMNLMMKNHIQTMFIITMIIKFLLNYCYMH